MSCTDATDCTAVGFGGNTNPDGDQEPIYATESDGVWGAVTEVTGWSAPQAQFLGVSCTDATDCTAVGTSGSELDNQAEAIYATESDGIWGTTSEFSGSPGGGNLTGVSCTDAKDCTAVGVAGVNDNGPPDYVTESDGIWGPLTQFPGTSDDSNVFSGVSCTNATDCTAIGYTTDEVPVYATEPSGTNDPSSISLVPLSALPAASGPVSYSVSVTGNGPTPTGSVTIFDDRGGSCVIASLASGSGSCAIEEELLCWARTGITASYPGDYNYDAATADITISSAVSTNGSATISSDQVIATATGGTNGVDTISEAQYGTDPVGSLTDGTNYFDVVTSPANTISSVVVQDCNNVSTSTLLTWWNPSDNGGQGAWDPIVGDPGPTFVPGSPACVSASLDSATSPTVAQLTGTVFGAATVTKLTVTTTSLPGGIRGHAYSAKAGGVQWERPLHVEVGGEASQGVEAQQGDRCHLRHTI